ncbi:hypothetical protein ACFY0F_34695 [Streptomyces sp. NPDC001544]|uniref:hypothetical protein n=1 Tax=Streptomyces sp. NPDC001544 TaxID=3364584 RepID=UPI003683CEC6
MRVRAGVGRLRRVVVLWHAEPVRPGVAECWSGRRDVPGAGRSPVGAGVGADLVPDFGGLS